MRNTAHFLLFNLILLCLGTTLLTAQTKPEGEQCGSTMQAHQERLDNDPEYRQRAKEWRKAVDPIIKARQQGRNPTCTNGPIVVPVAVHFPSGLISTADEACVITIVEDQIAELNLEILGQDSDATLINNFTSCFGSGILGDACIEFCLGTQNHPTGSGLASGDVAVTFGAVSFNVTGNNNTPVNSAWSDYINIYVDDLSGGLLGVSNGIPGDFNGDGVFVDLCVFGTGNISCPGVMTTGHSSCFNTYDEGETLAHELGHYLGLYHIWGDNSNCNGSQDQIADTPDMSNNYSGYTNCGNHNSCSDLPTTCGSEDMYMNFMSYAGDGCMYMFTSDQSDVMYATVVAEGYTTSSTKCTVPPPVAAFSPTGAMSLCGTDCTINYVDESTNSPDTWAWTFTVTSGNLTLDNSSSTLAFPEICVTGGTSGIITTELVVSNSGGSDNITQTLNVSISAGSVWYQDNDSDEYGNIDVTQTACTQPAGYVADNTDCDDSDANNYPGNTEVCDGADNNCDGVIDEGVTTTYYLDNDSDGFGDTNNSEMACTQPAGYVTDNTDCDDSDANNYPGNTEVCDGADNNCDGVIDEGLTTIYYLDNDSDNFGDTNNSVMACTQPAGYVTDNTDCDDSDANNYPGNTEVCDGADNNCDGVIDEGCGSPTDCDDTYLIINTITQNIYRAEINITSDAVVNNSQAVLFTAGTDIDLSPGFEVVIGTDFEAKIEPCTVTGGGSSKIQNPLSNILHELNTKLDGDTVILFVVTDSDNKIMKTFELPSLASNKDLIAAIGKLQKGFYKIKAQSEKTVIEKEVLIIK